MPQPHLLLHIGMPKTGTTSLQRALTKARHTLRAQGVLYPESPGLPDHPLLSLSCVGDPDSMPRLARPHMRGLPARPRIAIFRDELDREIETAGCDRVIMVAESLWLTLRAADEVQALADFLRPRFRKIDVLAYLRRPDEFAASMYGQTLREGFIRPPTLPVAPAGPRPLDAVLGQWEAAFGPGSVSVRLYERAALKDGDIVRDFADCAGIDLAAAGVDGGPRHNPSLSHAGQMVLLEMAERLGLQRGWQQGGPPPAWDLLVRHANGACPGPGWRPTRAEAAAFMARFAAANEAVRARYFPSRNTLFDEDCTGLPEDAVGVTDRQLAEAALDILASVLREKAGTAVKS